MRILTALCVLAGTLAHGALTLYSDGKANATLIVAPDACPVVRFAAEELRTCLKRAGNVELAVAAEAQSVTGAKILIGDSAAAKALGLSSAGLPAEGFVIRTVGDALVIVGDDDRMIDPAKPGYPHEYRPKGTLWGVYEFLERFVGARWYFPGPLGEIIPAVPTLTLPETAIADAPRFAVRTFWPTQALDLTALGYTDARELVLWRLRNRYGGAYAFPCNHSERYWPARFGKDHPEYFAVKKDGTRDNDPNDPYHGHLCYSEPGVLAQTIEDARDFFSGRRTLKINWDLASDGFLAVMPNDSYSGCECARCQARVDKDTENSELVWGFVSAVADTIRKEYPEAKITCCAYGNYGAVPKTVKIPDNVYVRLTASSIFGNAAGTLKNPTRLAGEERSRKLLDAWMTATNGRVSIWTYFNVQDGFLPLGGCGMSPHHIVSLFKPYDGRARGVFVEYSTWAYHKGESYQGQRVTDSTTCSSSWMLDHINRYVAGRALWNPNLDIDALLAEYHAKMFGKGAPTMRAFYDDLERVWLQEMVERDVVNEYVLWELIYTPATLARYQGWLDQAAALANGVEKDRVAFVRQWLFDEIATRRQEYLRRQGETDLRRADCPYVKTFGPVDGDKNKPAWAAVSAVGEFFDTQGNRAKADTQVKLAWDDQNLYALFLCAEPKIGELRTGNAPPHLWKNDGVEIFLAPAGDYRGGNFFQVLADAAGKSMALKVTGNQAAPWDSGVQVATRRYADLYTVELCIPFANLGAPRPQDDIAWRANFCRNRALQSAAEAENSSWSRILGGFYKPDKFSRLFFREGP